MTKVLKFHPSSLPEILAMMHYYCLPSVELEPPQSQLITGLELPLFYKLLLQYMCQAESPYTLVGA